MKIALHDLCAAWPRMSDAEVKKLAEDIKKNGLQCPITLYKGEILDGRNRAIACEMVGVEPTTTVYEGNDPVGYVVSKNLVRRHLTVSQRAMIAAKMANMKQGDNRFTGRSANSRVYTSQAVAAAILNVGARAVSDANIVLQSGDTELIEAVEKGKLSADPAARKVRARRKKSETPLKRPKYGRSRQPAPVPLAGLTGNIPKFDTIEEHQKWVDPEFVGTAMEFTDKYGHVQIMTAEQYATIRFGDWAGNMRATAKYMKGLPAFPHVDHNWLRSPRAHDVTRLAEALDYLRPKIAEAEGLLARVQSLRQPTAELLPTE